MSDDKWQSCMIVEVTDEGDRFMIRVDDGWSVSLPKKDFLATPSVGNGAHLGEFGQVVRGIQCGDKTVYYKSKAQLEQERLEWLAKKYAEEEQQLSDEREDRDLRWSKLPEVFQKRPVIFTKGQPRWRQKYEPYELFVCEQAFAIAEYFKTKEAIIAWLSLEADRQYEACPVLSKEHSGNTFGMSVRLARAYLEDPKLVPQMHGAIVPLVGCEECGCTHPREEP